MDQSSWTRNRTFDLCVYAAVGVFNKFREILVTTALIRKRFHLSSPVTLNLTHRIIWSKHKLLIYLRHIAKLIKNPSKIKLSLTQH
ncbi:hypothetical protein BpHYR1_005211 [Brachionus plicatilis]|uniref:Uncharacterized protein n=1 Tax=Brachionus plicatilis TaxID=10195 RepID=A0A3M7RP77_BRAPC|nr:hypothetical protein BpHYR1_005211 [Brachionus plicatilis]